MYFILSMIVYVIELLTFKGVFMSSLHECWWKRRKYNYRILQKVTEELPSNVLSTKLQNVGEIRSESMCCLYIQLAYSITNTNADTNTHI
jgi:hypothetical protein